MIPDENTKRMRFPEYDTVEFELEGAPAPLQWNPGEKALTWAKDPGIPPEFQTAWDEYLTKILRLLSEEVGNHVPAIAKVQLALDFDPCIAAGRVRVVEPYFDFMPKDAIW